MATMDKYKIMIPEKKIQKRGHIQYHMIFGDKV